MTMAESNFRFRCYRPSVLYANAHAAETGDKLWAYALVPHDAVLPSATLAGLLARYRLMAPTLMET